MRPSPCTPTERTSASSTTGHCQISRSRPAAVSSARTIASAARSVSSRSRVTSPTIRIPRPGPGNGWRCTISSGRPSSRADRADLVLEQRPQRLDQLELQVVRQPADVVVALDVRRALAAAGLHDVRVERALHEEPDLLALARAASGNDLAGGVLEDPDELAADRLALGLRVGLPGQRGQEPVRGVDDLEPDAGGGDEVPLHLLGLARPQQAVVDEHAGQLVADGPLDEGRGDRRVDPAGQPADHPAGADLRTDPGRPAPRSRCRWSSPARARRRGWRKLVSTCWPNVECRTSGCHWTPNSRRAAVLERRDRRAGRLGEHGEPGRRGLHRVPVAHPHRLRRPAARAAAWTGVRVELGRWCRRTRAARSGRPSPPSASAIAWKP